MGYLKRVNYNLTALSHLIGRVRQERDEACAEVIGLREEVKRLEQERDEAKKWQRVAEEQVAFTRDLDRKLQETMNSIYEELRHKLKQATAIIEAYNLQPKDRRQAALHTPNLDAHLAPDGTLLLSGPSVLEGLPVVEVKLLTRFLVANVEVPSNGK